MNEQSDLAEVWMVHYTVQKKQSYRTMLDWLISKPWTTHAKLAFQDPSSQRQAFVLDVTSTSQFRVGWCPCFCETQLSRSSRRDTYTTNRNIFEERYLWLTLPNSNWICLTRPQVVTTFLFWRPLRMCPQGSWESFVYICFPFAVNSKSHISSRKNENNSKIYYENDDTVSHW